MAHSHPALLPTGNDETDRIAALCREIPGPGEAGVLINHGIPNYVILPTAVRVLEYYDGMFHVRTVFGREITIDGWKPEMSLDVGSSDLKIPNKAIPEQLKLYQWESKK